MNTLRFAWIPATWSPKDFHLQVSAYAGRTRSRIDQRARSDRLVHALVGTSRHGANISWRLVSARSSVARAMLPTCCTKRS